MKESDSNAPTPARDLLQSPSAAVWVQGRACPHWARADQPTLHLHLAGTYVGEGCHAGGGGVKIWKSVRAISNQLKVEWSQEWWGTCPQTDDTQHASTYPAYRTEHSNPASTERTQTYDCAA
jgi:hypothetical protein